MSLASQIERLKQRSAEDRNAGHGYPATFRGQSIRVGLSAIAIGLDLDTGGLRQGGEFTARFLASALQSAPRRGEQLLIEGKTYTVHSVREQTGTPVEYVATIVPGSSL
jgi:hypothetical protein